VGPAARYPLARMFVVFQQRDLWHPRPVVDAFFDNVMVLDPDPAIRGAHLELISSVLSGFSGIADFSEIVTA